AALGAAAFSASADDSAVEAAIKSLVPGAKIDSIAESQVPNFYQVVLQGQVIYISADGRFLFQGSVFDIPNKIDLTENTKAGLRKGALAAAGPERRIIFPAKNEKYAVTVFTDIDCGYCRRMHGEMAEYNKRGISVEYLFFPRSGVGGESYDKAVSVWCATDRNKAMDNAKAGGKLESKTCDNPVAADYELGQSVGVNGTPAVYTRDGTQLGGYLPPEQLLQHLDALAGAR
ncbi:MAG: DsbC family protein, partial [Lysobacteraceae bacterium]